MSVNIGPKIGIDGEAEYRKQINQIIQQAKTLGSEMQVVSAKYEKNSESAAKLSEQSSVLKKQIETQKERVKLLSDMLAKSADEYGRNHTKTLKWEQAVNEANAELRRMENQLEDVSKESKDFKENIKGAGDALKSVGSFMGKGFVTLAKTGVATVAAAGAALVSLGEIGLDYNTQMESYTANFAVMLGSQEAAVKKVDSLKKMAASTPFEMAGLADATQQLLAFGVANEDTNKYLQQLGDISLGDADKLGTLVAAFGKMNSTGKVTLEYINMMAEQGFNPLNIIAQQTGETMTDLYKRLSDGGVSFEEITNAMAIATEQGGQFYKGMETASKTTEGLISTLKDNAVALVGEVFEPISESLKDELLPAAIESIDTLTEAFRENGVNGMIDAAGEIVGETVGAFISELPQFSQSAIDMINSLLDGIERQEPVISDGAVKTIDTLIDGLTNPEMIAKLTTTGALILTKVAAGLISEIPFMYKRIPEIVKAIVESFKAHGEEFKEIGKEIVRGIGDGIKAYVSWLGNTVSSLCNSAVSKAKDILGIHSPSRVFAEIGKNMALGIGLGWEKNISGIQKGIGQTLDVGVSSLQKQTVSDVSAGSRVTNVGGIEIKVYGAQGQDVNQLANIIMDRMEFAVRQKEAVFGV